MRIAFAGGGTGGHVFPIQSLIKYISKSRSEAYKLFWFGEKPSLEYNTYKKLQEYIKNITFFSIISGKRRREKGLMSFIKNIGDLIRLGVGFFQALWGLVYYKIDVVFCKGGYVSLPVVIAGWILRKKIILHESDTTPGLSNRICSKFASVIFTGFEGVFPEKEIIVGQILDDDLVSSGIKDEEIDKNKTHILVTGGSQGSESMYKALKNILVGHDFSNTFFHIILGTKNTNIGKVFNGLSNVKVYEFVDQETMGGLLHLCDVAITRGGTTSLAEQELFGIKKVIIPIPWTHDQLKNGMYYEKSYDDILVRQDSKTFLDDFTKAVIGSSEYKKGQYSNPLEIIRATKDKILSYIL